MARIGRELLGDDDFGRMMQNPLSAIPQAVEYVAQFLAEKTSTLMSVTNGADLLVAGMNEQEAAANVAEYYGIPLAALHSFPPQILQLGSPKGSAASRLILPNAGHSAYRRQLGFDSHGGTNRWRSRLTTSSVFPGWQPNGRTGRRRPFVGALTLEMPTAADDEVLSWIAAGPPPIYFGFGSTPIAYPADTVAAISAACAQLGERALIWSGPQ